MDISPDVFAIEKYYLHIVLIGIIVQIPIVHTIPINVYTVP